MYEAMRDLAEKWHAGKTRKARKGDPAVPYFEHPKAVVQTLLDWGEPEASAAVGIAWGHDLLEETDVGEARILAASDETVAAGIRMLTHEKDVPKPLYIRHIADCGSREELLVKLSDRIRNTRDFIHLAGPLRAYRYLHAADCIFAAVRKLPPDAVLKNAAAAWEELDERLKAEARHDAIRGCLLGGAVGDALGAPAEFLKMPSIRKLYGADGITGYVESGGTGAITDDTQMTLFTAEGMLHAMHSANGICNWTEAVYFACQRWLKTQGGRVPASVPPEELNSGWLIREKMLYSRRAPGLTCLSALENSCNADGARNNSKGCGTVMRMAPPGLTETPENAYALGRRFSGLTHGHPAGKTAGGAFAMLIAELLSGKSMEDALESVLAFLDTQKDAGETAAALRKARTADSITELGEGWVAEEALAIGVHCALKHPWDFRDGVLKAVNISGDSDSTGAITGNIIGVINGESAIPPEWLAGLREREIVSRIADELWQARYGQE